MKATIIYQGGMHFLGRTDSGHNLHLDSAHSGEKTAGPTPIEMVLQAAAACSAMDVVAILQKRRKEIASFDLEVEGDRRDEHPRTFRSLKVHYRVVGPGITFDEVERAVKLSHDRYCSVINMLKPAVEVSYSVEVPPQDLEK